MADASSRTVLHLTSAAGGGVDRYIRDAAATTKPRHVIWHAGEAIDVIEDLAAGRFTPLRDVARSPLAAPALDAWRRGQGVALVHLHGVDRALRARLALLDPALPAVATLHDVGFLSPDPFAASAAPSPDPGWIAEVAASLARVAAIAVPSSYVRAEAERAFPAATLVDVAPGIAPAAAASPFETPSEFAARRFERVVAIVGAIGPHKGSALVGAIASGLARERIGLVVVGYTDSRIERGFDGDCFVHGPYLDAQLRSLLAGYRVDVALFPNRLPESFSYTLSEAWAASIPVVVPDHGALGERVARHGGGWRLPAGFGAADAVDLLRTLLSAQGDAELARVKSQIDPADAGRIPDLASMSRALDALYERFAAPPPAQSGAPSADPLAPLMAANLDGFAFRAELLRFAEELDNARAAIAELRAALASAQQWARTAEANGQAWAAKLERDVESLRAEVRARDETLARLPAPFRKWLVRRALRDRG